MKLSKEENILWSSLCSGKEAEVNEDNLPLYKSLFDKVRWIKNSSRTTLLTQLAKIVGYKPIIIECGKIPFFSKEMARKELKRIREEAELYGQKTDRIPIRSYECDKCSQWHLTSKQKYLNIYDEN